MSQDGGSLKASLVLGLLLWWWALWKSHQAGDLGPGHWEKWEQWRQPSAGSGSASGINHHQAQRAGQARQGMWLSSVERPRPGRHQREAVRVERCLYWCLGAHLCVCVCVRPRRHKTSAAIPPTPPCLATFVQKVTPSSELWPEVSSFWNFNIPSAKHHRRI